jgi:hypothetical protein
MQASKLQFKKKKKGRKKKKNLLHFADCMNNAGKLGIFH